MNVTYFGYLFKIVACFHFNQLIQAFEPSTLAT